MPDKDSIPPRLGDLEKKMHTMEHRVAVFERAHEHTPVRLSRLESAFESLGELRETQKTLIEGQAENNASVYVLSNSIRGYFQSLRLMLMSAGAVCAGVAFIYNYGAAILQFMGMK